MSDSSPRRSLAEVAVELVMVAVGNALADKAVAAELASRLAATTSSHAPAISTQDVLERSKYRIDLRQRSVLDRMTGRTIRLGGAAFVALELLLSDSCVDEKVYRQRRAIIESHGQKVALKQQVWVLRHRLPRLTIEARGVGRYALLGPDEGP